MDVVNGPAHKGFLSVGGVYRYPAPPHPDKPFIDDELPNWFWVTSQEDLPSLKLDKGVNGVAEIVSAGRLRRPAVLVRSTPWKAGTTQTPWRDVFDLDRRHVRYFGDNKPGTGKLAHETPGNRVLRHTALEHASRDPLIRARSTPVLVFRSHTLPGRPKGQISFCGVGVIVGHEYVRQTDPTSGTTFGNYAFELALIDLQSEGQRLNLEWIRRRRSPTFDTLGTLEPAPASWRSWVDHGAPPSNSSDGDVAVTIAELDQMISPHGQGLLVDPAPRQKVELLAMGVTRAYFESRGWSVSDVSATAPYDFDISKNGATKHVEVKGTQSGGSQVLLTANEVEHAREIHPGVVLAIVSGIQLVEQTSEDGTLEFRAAGGTLRLIDPVDFDTGVLRPVTYVYRPLPESTIS